MAMKPKASILWIILLQSRQFASGEFEVHAEFCTIHSTIVSKHAIIHHAEVSIELVSHTGSKPDKKQLDPNFD
jgi:hypothetical protein